MKSKIISGENRGWKGDVPKMLLSIDKMQTLGWNPSHSSKSSVIASTRSTLEKR